MGSFPETYIDLIKLVMLYCHAIYIYIYIYIYIFLGGWGAKGIGGGVGCGCENASVKNNDNRLVPKG